MCKWGAALFVAFESKVSRREDVQCLWASLWYGDLERFFDGVLFRGGDWFNKGGSIKGVVVVEMVVGVVDSVVLAESEVLLKVVILGQLIV